MNFPSEVPAGAVLALIGAPSLYYLPEEDTNANLSCIFRAIGFYIITLSMMVLLFGLSIRLGTYTLSFEEIWAAFQPDDKNYFTLMEYRLPRAVLAILLGGALAISGVLVQSVVRNPLASPDILGINNAAGLVAVSVLMFLPNLAFYWMPIFAFLGGVLSFCHFMDRVRF